MKTSGAIYILAYFFFITSGLSQQLDGRTNIPNLSPLLITDDGKKITSADEWKARREEIKRKWINYLGQFPSDKPPLKAEVISVEKLDGFTRKYVKYQIEEGEFTDAYLLVPNGAQGQLPEVVVFHPTVNTHIKESAGVEGSDTNRMFGVDFVRDGYIVLCPRCYIFKEGGNFTNQVEAMKIKHPNWKGITRMLLDAIRAADYLESLPNVDTNRIGCFGHSLGAKEVLYAAAFDERYKAAVFSEGGIGIKFSNWDAIWYLGNGVNKPAFNLEHHQLMALIAPRPFMLIGGDSADGDKSLPFINAAKDVYELLYATEFLNSSIITKCIVIHLRLKMLQSDL
jgi:dienelactone hydrolase